MCRWQSCVCGVCSTELPLTSDHIDYCRKEKREGGRERKREGERGEKGKGKMKRGKEIEERERERESTIILCIASKIPPCSI